MTATTTDQRPLAAPDWATLREAFPDWAEPGHDLFARLDARYAPAAHGDLPKWQAALAALPDLTVTEVRCDDTVTITGPAGRKQRAALTAALRDLRPWRKGPFDLFGVHIDTEWRSDWKWQRVAPHLDPLAGGRILDVGCGSGYFGWRMLGCNADLVIGIDPTLLFCMQHLAINRYIASHRNWVLPLRLEEFPVTQFDTVFSMGVVYHRRDPLEHVDQLAACLRPGGQLVLESLVIIDGPDLRAPERYARMRNVRVVPTLATLTGWLAAAGLADVRVADVTPTTVDEQRSTPWMPHESLAQALDPADPSRTVEGHPAPRRAVVLARKPS